MAGQCVQVLASEFLGQLGDGHGTVGDPVADPHAVREATPALDVAAGVVMTMKIETIAELRILADQVAEVATFGLAAAGVVAIRGAGKRSVNLLEQ